MTRVAARGERKGTSCRSSGGAYNALKGAGGLWHALLQWFVDALGKVKARSDSNNYALRQGAGDEKVVDC